MTERYTFAANAAGLAHALEMTLTLRRAGYKTRLAEETIGTTVVAVLHATPAPRPNRKARGCSGR